MAEKQAVQPMDTACALPAELALALSSALLPPLTLPTTLVLI